MSAKEAAAVQVQPVADDDANAAWLYADGKGQLSVYRGSGADGQPPTTAGVRVPPHANFEAADLAELWNSSPAASAAGVTASPSDTVAFKGALTTTEDLVRAYDEYYGAENPLWTQLADDKMRVIMQQLIDRAAAQPESGNTFGSALSVLVDFCKSLWVVRNRLRKVTKAALHPKKGDDMPRVDLREPMQDYYQQLCQALWRETVQNFNHTMGRQPGEEGDGSLRL
jgi:hypothetical protein